MSGDDRTAHAMANAVGRALTDVLVVPIKVERGRPVAKPTVAILHRPLEATAQRQPRHDIKHAVLLRIRDGLAECVAGVADLRNAVEARAVGIRQRVGRICAAHDMSDVSCVSGLMTNDRSIDQSGQPRHSQPGHSPHAGPATSCVIVCAAWLSPFRCSTAPRLYWITATSAPRSCFERL